MQPADLLTHIRLGKEVGRRRRRQQQSSRKARGDSFLPLERRTRGGWKRRFCCLLGLTQQLLLILFLSHCACYPATSRLLLRVTLWQQSHSGFTELKIEDSKILPRNLETASFRRGFGRWSPCIGQFIFHCWEPRSHLSVATGGRLTAILDVASPTIQLGNSLVCTAGKKYPVEQQEHPPPQF